MRTTMGYSLERKEAVLKKMLPPNNQSIAVLAKEEGISDATLYNWRQQARNEGRLMPDVVMLNPDKPVEKSGARQQEMA